MSFFDGGFGPAVAEVSRDGLEPQWRIVEPTHLEHPEIFGREILVPELHDNRP